MDRIYPEDESFSILKIHHSKQVNELSVCYGSVEYEGEYFYALYIISSEQEVWLYDLRNELDNRRPSKSAIRELNILANLLIKGYDIHGNQRPLIPIEIAVDGKPAIAAYLHIFRECGTNQIADLLEVSEPTVQKYLIRFSEKTVELDY